jgi:hypothetical protein
MCTYLSKISAELALQVDSMSANRKLVSASDTVVPPMSSLLPAATLQSLLPTTCENAAAEVTAFYQFLDDLFEPQSSNLMDALARMPLVFRELVLFILHVLSQQHPDPNLADAKSETVDHARAQNQPASDSSSDQESESEFDTSNQDDPYSPLMCLADTLCSVGVENVKIEQKTNNSDHDSNSATPSKAKSANNVI